MNTIQRNVIMQVAQGNQVALSILHQFSQLKRHHEIYAWLDRNNIRGQKFVDWYNSEHDGSFIFATTAIIATLEREKKPRPLFDHKDFL